MCGALWGWCQASNNVYKRIVPLLDRVLVQRSKAPEKTASGLYIPEKAKNKLNEGEVVAVGPGGRDTHGNLIPVSVKVGDTVLLPEYGGNTIKLGDQDEVCTACLRPLVRLLPRPLVRLLPRPLVRLPPLPLVHLPPHPRSRAWYGIAWRAAVKTRSSTCSTATPRSSASSTSEEPADALRRRTSRCLHIETPLVRRACLLAQSSVPPPPPSSLLAGPVQRSLDPAKVSAGGRESPGCTNLFVLLLHPHHHHHHTMHRATGHTPRGARMAAMPIAMEKNMGELGGWEAPGGKNEWEGARHNKQGR